MSKKEKSVPKLPRKSMSRLCTPIVPQAPEDELTAPGSPFEPTPAGRHSDDPPEDPDQGDGDQGDDEEGQGGDDGDDEDETNASKYDGGLRSATDATLVELLGQSLRDALEEALTLGVTPKQLLYSAKILTGGRINPKGGILFMGIEAFLAKKAQEEKQRKPVEKIAPY